MDQKFSVRNEPERIVFILVGDKGAVTLSMYKHDSSLSFNYHAKSPQRDGQRHSGEMEYFKNSEKCEYLGNECFCYCDGRGLHKVKIEDVDILKYLQIEYDCLK
jgi:hypothetical protein